MCAWYKSDRNFRNIFSVLFASENVSINLLHKVLPYLLMFICHGQNIQHFILKTTQAFPIQIGIYYNPDEDKG